MDTLYVDMERTRRRLPRRERERRIVDEAIQFFAEVGFEGQTRALAQRLGVTQPLLYRYFPDKNALIERVYQEVFMGGWDDQWPGILSDRNRPLQERIIDVYRAYARLNFSFARVRLFLYASLKDQATAAQYLGFLRDQLFVPMAREIRADMGLDPDREPSAAEVECVANFHGAIGYLGLRQFVYQEPVTDDLDKLLVTLVTSFLDGAPAAYRGLPENQ